jgi:uncharacterized membrane protein
MIWYFWVAISSAFSTVKNPFPSTTEIIITTCGYLNILFAIFIIYSVSAKNPKFLKIGAIISVIMSAIGTIVTLIFMEQLLDEGMRDIENVDVRSYRDSLQSNLYFSAGLGFFLNLIPVYFLSKYWIFLDKVKQRTVPRVTIA